MNGALSLEEMAEERLLERYGRSRSALGPGTVIQGKLTFDTTIRIDGNLSGDIYSSKAIIVARSGIIDAKIDAAVLVVIGCVKGDIRISDRLEILRGGIVEGKIETPKLIIEPGGILNARCKMQSEKNSAVGSKKEGQHISSNKETLAKVIETENDASGSRDELHISHKDTLPREGDNFLNLNRVQIF
jgi:cytoskeletal protein CcmA (bactofilin family)